MSDRPILFSGPMIQALLDGRKTQTRRLLSIKGKRGFFQFGVSDTPGYDWTFRRADHVWEDYEHDRLLSLLPIATGDRLWVRETIVRSETDQGVGFAVYAADHATVPFHGEWWRSRTYIPSIHMCRTDSRLTLTVTDVRVQRLQDISGEDCIAEGVKCETCAASQSVGRSACNERGCFEIRQNFRDLWNSLHGPDAWSANPWVAAYTFTVQRGNIDEVML